MVPQIDVVRETMFELSSNSKGNKDVDKMEILNLRNSLNDLVKEKVAHEDIAATVARKVIYM